MSKPLGLSIGIGESGLSFEVSRPSKVEDAIWEAVEQAIAHGWTPEQFKRECASAWSDRLRQDAKYADEVLSR
jgi:hypothetical protein